MAQAAFPGANGKIAFARYPTETSPAEIYTINPDGTGEMNITSNPADDTRPAWSPNGTKIAFVTGRDGNSGIYTMNADGTGLVILTINSSEPAWSPDGTKLAFRTNSDIYTMNADGTGRLNISNNPAVDANPAWSPDGTKIAFQSDRSGSHEIYTMNADGTGQTRLTNYSSLTGAPNWSPDGTKIAFYSFRSGNAEIYTMNADGSGVTNLTNNAAGDEDPAWSPDGTKIAFFSYGRDGNQDIYTMNADGSAATKVTSSPPGGASAAPDWQPLKPVRPKGATPFRASLVVAYRNCTVPNEQHGPALAFPSCAPPVQESNWLTTGTSDSNGGATQFIGSLRLDTLVGDPATPADEADVAAVMNITDVRNKADMTDYAGSVQASVVLRITDRFNAVAAGGGGDAATVVDIPFPVNAACTPTADPLVGSTCAVTTSFEAIVPGAVREHQRSVWQMGQVQVYDGGADGNPSTADNTLFARQGVFVP